MQQLQWLSGCMKDKRKWFWLAMALAVVSAGLCVVFPFITQQITDRVLVGQTLPDGSVQRQTQLLVPLVCVMIGAQLLRSCVRYGMTASLEYVSQNVQQDIRRHLYDNLCTQDAGFYTRYRTGDLMTRLTGDLDMVRHTVCWISYNAVESTCLFLFSMTYLFSVNAALTLLLLAVAPVILACSFLFSRTVYPLYASLREKLSRMNSVAQENIAGNKTVRAFVREAYEKRIPIGCTGCGYCQPCPQGVKIPEIFQAYDRAAMFDDRAAFRAFYAKEERPGCVGCLACESACPQHFAMPIHLRIQAIAEEMRP